MIVWVVYTEYQNTDPSINGVFSTRLLAEEQAKIETDRQEKEYQNVVFNHRPDDASDDYDESDWDVDIHIEEHTIDEVNPL